MTAVFIRDCANRAVQVEMARSLGGQVYQDPNGRIFAVSEDVSSWPISSSARRLELQAVPTDWSIV